MWIRYIDSQISDRVLLKDVVLVAGHRLIRVEKQPDRYWVTCLFNTSLSKQVRTKCSFFCVKDCFPFFQYCYWKSIELYFVWYFTGNTYIWNRCGVCRVRLPWLKQVHLRALLLKKTFGIRDTQSFLFLFFLMCPLTWPKK